MPFAMVVSSRFPTRDKPNSLCHTDHRAVARVSRQFKNSGAEAGATQQHPHSQLIGFPVVPAHTKELLSAARAHHEVNGTCVHCRMVERLQQPSEEGGSGKELVVYSNDEFVSERWIRTHLQRVQLIWPGWPPVGLLSYGFPERPIVNSCWRQVAFVPWAPPCDYAIVVMPFKHTADLLLDVAPRHAIDGGGSASEAYSEAGQRTIAALADCLRMALRKLYRYCGNPPFNLVVRNPPFAERRASW